MAKRVKQKQIDKLLAEASRIEALLKAELGDMPITWGVSYDATALGRSFKWYKGMKDGGYNPAYPQVYIKLSTTLAKLNIKKQREIIIHKLAQSVVELKDEHGKEFREAFSRLLSIYRFKTGELIKSADYHHFSSDINKQASRLYRQLVNKG
ncbi:MAG: hypothetical protein OXF49_03130 [Candidatus Saccharibacteria bacterium]|nr:hypothetical protein [Candidatus Saccharibacteria bacterium]